MPLPFGSTIGRIKKREHYEELSVDEVKTAAGAAGTLSGKTAAKVARRLKSWKKSGRLERMIKDQSEVNAAAETASYSAATEAIERLQKSNKFAGMDHDRILADLSEVTHFGAAAQMAGQVSDAKGKQSVLGGSIGSAMTDTAIENSFWRGSHEGADAAGVKAASAKTVATVATQDSRTRGTQARLAEFKAYSDDKLNAREYLKKKQAELAKAKNELETKEGDLEGVADKEQKVKEADAKVKKAFKRMLGAKNTEEQREAMNEWTAARHELDEAVQDLEETKKSLQAEREETIEAFRNKKISGNEFAAKMRDIDRREKGLGNRAKEIEAARQKVALAEADVQKAEAYNDFVESRYSAENHGQARYKQTAETAATGRVVGEKGVLGFEHAADLKSRTQHETGLEAMRFNARGVDNDTLAEASAVLSLSRPGNYAVAAQNMADTGFLDKVFNRSNAATQRQLEQHGFGDGALRSLSAIQAQSHYALNTVLDGYDVYMTSDAEGNYGSDMIRAQKGADVRATMNVDNITGAAVDALGDGIGTRVTAAGVKSGVESLVDGAMAILPGGKVFRALEGVGKIRAAGGVRQAARNALTTGKWDGKPRSEGKSGGEGAKEAAPAPRPEMPNGQVQPGITIKPIPPKSGGSKY